MDLLASYSDDGDSARNTPTSDRSEQMMPKLDAVQSDVSLQAEWESFEKMISGAEEPTSVPPPMTVAYPVLSSQVHSKTPNTDSYSDPPVLTIMKDTDQVDMFESDDTQVHKIVPQISNSGQPPKLTDITLAPEFNTDGMYGEMPTLTKITGSSPEHSSSRSSSSSRSRSRSRSHSVDSDKSEPEQKSELEKDRKKKATSPTELPAAFKKDLSPCRSSTSHKKSVKREKRSRSKSRSPRRKRRRSSDRKRSHSRSPGKRKSSDRKRRSRSRDKRSRRSSSRSRHRRRSHSRSRRRSSRERRSSRDRHRRRGSRERRRDRKNRRRRSRSHDRHRSLSKSRSRSRERPRAAGGPKEKHLTFKEKMRQQLLKASKILTDKEGAGPSEFELSKEQPSNLPLSAANIFSSISQSGNVTPQMALLQTMAAMHQKAQEMTGVAVPKFYNPAAVNPLKYAEQVQKRKLLWSKNKEKKEDEGQWQSTAFVQDQDGKMAAKFRKLMGMKEEDEEKTEEVDEEKARETEEKKKKTEEMFYRLDKEYEFARMTTHTQRGVGLGFHSQGFPNP